jgi:tetratricopeptide (TPR) repeat protein
VRKALSLDETLPQAITLDGVLRFFLDWNWQGAKQALDQAVHLDPPMVERNACNLHCLQTVGRPEEAFRAVERAVTLSDSIAIEAELSCAAYYEGNFAKVETYGLETLKKDPENFLLYFNLGRPLAQEGRYEQALVMLKKDAPRPAVIGAACWPKLLIFVPDRERQTNPTKSSRSC